MDLFLGRTFTKRYRLQSDGGAYTISDIGFKPDYSGVWNLTKWGTTGELVKHEWFIGMGAADSLETQVIVDNGTATAKNLILATSNGFTLVENAGGVTERRGVITGATAADPVVITDSAHGLSSGDVIRITDVVGMTQLNNNRYKVTVLTANTFSLQDPVTGEDVDGSNFTAYVSGGTWNLLNRIDANRTSFEPVTYDMTLGTDIMANDDDILQVLFLKFGDFVDLGDVA